jgi:RNA polymerase sigma factor (sigma-70 family)
MTPRLAHARRGQRAFERLYRRHVGDVYRYALVLLRDPRAAEEVTKMTFLNAYRVHRRGERAPNAHAWLLALAHAICRQRFRAAFPETAPDDDAALRAVPEEEGPSAAQIRRALERLPFDLRAVLAMRELEGRPYSEIAEVLALPAGEVEVVVFRARRALREQLEGTLTCHQAERAVSRQVDGLLPRSERRLLRAHLRECDECARFARSQRAQRSAWKALAAIPLPASLQSFFGADGVMAAAARTAGSATVGAVATAVAIAVVAVSAAALGYDSSDDTSVGAAGPALEPEAIADALTAAAAVQPRHARPHRPQSAPRRATAATTPRAAPVATKARAPRKPRRPEVRVGAPRAVHVHAVPTPTAQAQIRRRAEEPDRAVPPPASTSTQPPPELLPQLPPVPPLPLPLPLPVAPPQPPQLP